MTYLRLAFTQRRRRFQRGSANEGSIIFEGSKSYLLTLLGITSASLMSLTFANHLVLAISAVIVLLMDLRAKHVIDNLAKGPLDGWAS